MNNNQWQKRKLKEVCTQITVGYVGSMAKEYVDNGIPFLRSQNILPFKLNLDPSNLKYITPEFHKKIKKSALNSGDIAVVRTGYPGVACVIPKTLKISNCSDLVILRPSEKLDPYYLACVFNSTWGRRIVQGSLVGVAQQHFNVGVAKELEISLPPLPTQKKIAGILSAYDDLIENNTRRIEILEEMARMLYREWFVKFRFPVGDGMGDVGGNSKGDRQLNNPVANKGDRLSDSQSNNAIELIESELGLIPKGWEVKKLGDIAQEIRRGVKPENLSSDTPYIGLEHLPRRSIALSEWGTVEQIKSTKLIFQKGEILFGKIRPYFHKVGVAPIDGVCSSDAIVIQAKDEKYFPLVLSCVSSDEFVAHATQTSQGTKMPRANWKVLIEYPVLIPPEQLIEKFNNVVLDIIPKIHNLIFKNINLRKTRDLLLPRLISGEIDVENLDINTGDLS